MGHLNLESQRCKVSFIAAENHQLATELEEPQNLDAVVNTFNVI